MLLFLATACLSPDARPYDDYLRDRGLSPQQTGDTGDAPTVQPATRPPTPPPPPTVFDACSTAGDPIEVTFTNDMGFHVDLFYIREDCSRQNTTLILNGESTTRTTHVGAVWRAWNAFGGGGFVDEVVISADSAAVEFTP